MHEKIHWLKNAGLIHLKKQLHAIAYRVFKIDLLYL